MTIKSKLAVVLAAGTMLGFIAAPASAASVRTVAFLANVHPNIDFLDRSSRMALDHSSNPRLRAFARDEAREQTLSANSLVAWNQTNTTAGAVGAVAVGDTIVPVVGVATAPVAVDDVVTGRSVAVDVPVPLTVTPRSTSLLPAGQADLDRLAQLDGRAFDGLYRTTQTDALRQLMTLYTSYIENGDDPTLRDFAIGELPKIRARLDRLRRI